ncbi:MAG: hypothetical protein P8X89_15205 [Reinekea sp.]
MDRSNWPPHNMNYYSQVYQEEGQQVPHSESGHMPAGATATGVSGSHPAPGQQPQPYLDLNFPPPSEPDWEYLQHASQPVAMEGITWSGAPRHTTPKLFMAGLEAFEQGVSLEDCSSSIRFDRYISNNGQLTRKGVALYDQLMPEDRMRFNQAIIARNAALLDRVSDEPPVAADFLAGLGNYAEGVSLKDCSSSIRFDHYISNNGQLTRKGVALYDQLTPEGKMQLNQAIIARNAALLDQVSDKPPVVVDFLTGLGKYAEGAPLSDCSTTLPFEDYVSNNGRLKRKGQMLYINKLNVDEKRWVSQALVSRREIFS